MNKKYKKGQKFKVLYEFSLSNYYVEPGDTVKILNVGKWTLHVQGTGYFKQNGRRKIDKQFEDIVDRYDFLDFVEIKNEN